MKRMFFVVLPLFGALPVLGQQPVTSASGATSILGVPGYTGLFGLSAAEKAIGFDWSYERLRANAGSGIDGIALGLKFKGSATNDVAAIIKSGDLVPEATVKVRVGVQLLRPDLDTRPMHECSRAVEVRFAGRRAAVNAIENEDEKDRASRQVEAERAKEVELCVERQLHATVVGGIWLFGNAGYKGASYKVVSSDSTFESQVKTHAFDGGSFELALNGWLSLDGWTIISGASIGWEKGNSIKDMKPVVVRETFAEAFDSTGTVRREFNRKDVSAFSGRYETFSLVPFAVDVFLSRLSTARNAGLWFFVRGAQVEGSRQRPSSLGLGIFVFKPENPFVPLGALNIEWVPDANDVRLNLTAGINVF